MIRERNEKLSYEQFVRERVVDATEGLTDEEIRQKAISFLDTEPVWTGEPEHDKARFEEVFGDAVDKTMRGLHLLINAAENTDGDLHIQLKAAQELMLQSSRDSMAAMVRMQAALYRIQGIPDSDNPMLSMLLHISDIVVENRDSDKRAE